MGLSPRDPSERPVPAPAAGELPSSPIGESAAAGRRGGHVPRDQRPGAPRVAADRECGTTSRGCCPGSRCCCSPRRAHHVVDPVEQQGAAAAAASGSPTARRAARRGRAVVHRDGARCTPITSQGVKRLAESSSPRAPSCGSATTSPSRSCTGSWTAGARWPAPAGGAPRLRLHPAHEPRAGAARLAVRLPRLPASGLHGTRPRFFSPTRVYADLRAKYAMVTQATVAVALFGLIARPRREHIAASTSSSPPSRRGTMEHATRPRPTGGDYAKGEVTARRRAQGLVRRGRGESSRTTSTKALCRGPRDAAPRRAQGLVRGRERGLAPGSTPRDEPEGRRARRVVDDRVDDARVAGLRVTVRRVDPLVHTHRAACSNATSFSRRRADPALARGSSGPVPRGARPCRPPDEEVSSPARTDPDRHGLAQRPVRPARGDLQLAGAGDRRELLARPLAHVSHRSTIARPYAGRRTDARLRPLRNHAPLSAKPSASSTLRTCGFTRANRRSMPSRPSARGARPASRRPASR